MSADDDLVTVLVVDDHDIFRAAALAVVDGTPGFRVVGEAISGAAAVEFVAASPPDLVLMDVRMPGMDGVEAASQILADHPAVRVLLYSSSEGGEVRTPEGISLQVAAKESLSPSFLRSLWDADA